MLRRLRSAVISLPVVITFNDCVASIARADPASLGLTDDADGQAADRPGLPVGDRVRAGACRAEDGGLLTASTPSSASSSSSSSASYVLLDRSCARTFSFTRGDVVYLRDPHNHARFTVQRLVAMEGDWVTRHDSDDVEKVPKGHCWLESVGEKGRRGRRGGRERGGGRAGGGGRGGGGRRRDRGEEEGTVASGGDTGPGSGSGSGFGFASSGTATSDGRDLGAVPLALLDSRVRAVLWPPTLAGVLQREVPPGRVLMQHTAS